MRPSGIAISSVPASRPPSTFIISRRRARSTRIPRIRRGFLNPSASSASSTSAWTSTSSDAAAAARLAVRDDRPGGEDRSCEPSAANQHPLARRQDLRRTAALSLRLGCRLHGLRPERGDELHRPTKTPEFLAAGVPVVSTPIADVVRPTARRASSRSPRCRRGRRQGGSDHGPSEGGWLAKVDRHLAAGSWDKTWAPCTG